MARLPDETALGRAGSFRSGRAILRQEVVGTSGAGAIIAKAVEGFGATAGNVARDQLKRREQAEAALQQRRDATDAIRATTEHTRGLNEITRTIGAEPDFAKHGALFEREAKKLTTRTGDLIGNEALRKNFLGQAEERTASFRTRVLANVVRLEFEAARTDIDAALQTHFALYTDGQAQEPQRVQALAQLNDIIILGSARGLFTPEEAEDKRQTFVFGAVRQDAALQVARDPRRFLAELEVKNGRFAVLRAETRSVMARVAGAQAVAAAIDADPASVKEVLGDPLVAKNLSEEQQDKARDDALVRIEALEKSKRTEAIQAFATATPELVARATGNETFTDADGNPQPAGPPLSVADTDAMITQVRQGGAKPEALRLHEELHQSKIAQGGAKQARLDARVFGELMQSISDARITRESHIDVEASVTALVGVQARVLRAQREGRITNAQAESMLTRVVPAVMAQVERQGGASGGARPESGIAELYEHGFGLISDLSDGTDEANNLALKASLFTALVEIAEASAGQALNDPEKKSQAREEIGLAIRRTLNLHRSGGEAGGDSVSEAEPESGSLADELDRLQLALDVAGLTPGVGIGADAVSALISLARGNLDDAGLSLLAAAPIIGQAAGAAKIARAVRRLKRKADKALGKAKKEAPDTTKRPSGVRKGTIEKDWNEAALGSNPGSKACPTCGKDVFVAPGQGPRDWDVDHQPPFSERLRSGRISKDKTRKQNLDDFNTDTRLECPSCNRSRGARPLE